MGETDPLTLAETLRIVIVTGALILSGWALIDDAWDLVNVRRYGEVGGPRWVLAMEHVWFNATLLLGWLCFLGVVGIAISLPPRENTTQDTLAQIASWLNFGYGCCVFMAQVHRRVGRIKLRSLPLAAWERMLKSMMDGMSVAEREALTVRLATAVMAGREMGHLIRREVSPAVGLVSLVMATAMLTSEERANLEEVERHLMAVCDRAPHLHEEIRAQESMS